MAKKKKGVKTPPKGKKAQTSKKPSAKAKSDLPQVKCEICGHEARCLTNHLRNEHQMKGKEYQAQHPGAALFAPDLMAGFAAKGKEGIHNKWNLFVKLFGSLDDKKKERVVAFAEKTAGKTLDDFMS